VTDPTPDDVRRVMSHLGKRSGEKQKARPGYSEEMSRRGKRGGRPRKSTIPTDSRAPKGQEESK
jgi:hypothetical protein